MAKERKNIITILLKDLASPGLKRFNRTAGKVAGYMAGAFAAGFAVAGAAMAKLGVMAVKSASQMETLRTQFTSLFDSVSMGNERMELLTKLAAKTPFRLEDIAKANKMFQALGGNALATGEKFQRLIDITAFTGNAMDEVARPMGRLIAKLQAGDSAIVEEVNRMSELGAISRETGAKIKSLSGDIEGGALAVRVFMSETEKFNGAAEDLSKTFSGKLSTLMDNFNLSLGKIAEGTMPALKSGVDKLIAALQKLEKDGSIQKWAKSSKTAVESVISTLEGININDLDPVLADQLRKRAFRQLASEGKLEQFGVGREPKAFDEFLFSGAPNISSLISSEMADMIADRVEKMKLQEQLGNVGKAPTADEVIDAKIKLINQDLEKEMRELRAIREEGELKQSLAAREKAKADKEAAEAAAKLSKELSKAQSSVEAAKSRLQGIEKQLRLNAEVDKIKADAQKEVAALDKQIAKDKRREADLEHQLEGAAGREKDFKGAILDPRGFSKFQQHQEKIEAQRNRQTTKGNKRLNDALNIARKIGALDADGNFDESKAKGRISKTGINLIKAAEQFQKDQRARMELHKKQQQGILNQQKRDKILETQEKAVQDLLKRHQAEIRRQEIKDAIDRLRVAEEVMSNKTNGILQEVGRALGFVVVGGDGGGGSGSSEGSL